MDNSLSLRVAAVFIMFGASLLGVVLPLYFSGGGKIKDEASHQKMADSAKFRILRTFAAGIMLGVGFIHLLNDGVNKLAIVSVDYPSLGYTLATVGALVVLGFEQIAVMLISRVKAGGSRSSSSNSLNGSDHAHSSQNTHNSQERQNECNTHNLHSTHETHDKSECAPVLTKDSDNTSHLKEAKEAEEAEEDEIDVIPAPDESHHYCDHNHAIQMIAGTDSLSVIVKAYMMEISVAIHSIIIGITLGSLSGPENIPSLRALVVAISFHQFFEGLGLGTVIEAARLHLGIKKVIIFAVTFAATVPVGIAIGIILTKDRAVGEGPTDSELYVTGCLNALAAGILIYVSLVEMIGEDFQHAAIASREDLKIQMFIALTTGTLFMAILAIWA